MPTNPLRLLPGLFAVMLFGALSLTPALAENLSTYYWLSYQGGGPDTQTQNAAEGPLTADVGTSNLYGTVISQTEADYGIIHSYASASSGGPGGGYTNWAISQGSWSDTLLIDAEGLTGQTGYLTVAYWVDGSLSATQNGALSTYAKARLSVNLNDYLDSVKYELYGNGDVVGESFFNEERSLTASFTYGTPFTLSFLVRGDTRINSNYSGAGIVDMGHTAYWGGFTEVTDSEGDPVTNYTASSQSGTNYVSAIPEPTAVTSVLAGAFVLAFGRRLRGARRD